MANRKKWEGARAGAAFILTASIALTLVFLSKVQDGSVTSADWYLWALAVVLAAPYTVISLYLALGKFDDDQG